MATQKQSDVHCERMKELTAADDLDSVSLSDQNRVKEDVCLNEISLTKDQTATSSVLSGENYVTLSLLNSFYTLCFSNKTIVVDVLQEKGFYAKIR